MLQNTITIKKYHRKFIEEVVSNGHLWALKSKTGFASSQSNKFEYDDGEPVVILCFWSDKKLASTL